MAYVETIIVITKSLALGFGALITYFALKAYRRTGEPALRALAIGFAIVTVGGVAGGVFDIGLNMPLLWSIALQSALTALGFAVITYSLYTQ